MNLRFLSTLASSLISMSVLAGGITSGGVPRYEYPVDIYFKCEAKLGIYIIAGQNKHYGIFKRSFELKAKKGEFGTYGVLQGYLQLNPEKWILEQSTAENVDMTLFQPILEERNEVSLSLKSLKRTDDPAQLASITAWLGLPDPDEVFAYRTVKLNETFVDLNVIRKIHKDDYYSSQSLEVECTK